MKRTTIHVRRIAAALLALSLAAVPVFAEPTPEQQAEAKTLYAAGTQHYNLGEYEDAIARYKEAYRLVANPYFLYNIAQSYRLADDFKQSLAFYKSFLNARPDAPERKDVEQRIQELEDILRKQAQAQAAAPTAPVSPAEPPRLTLPPDHGVETDARPSPLTTVDLAPEGHRPIYRTWWFWAGIGIVAAGASTVVIMSGGEAPPSSDLGNFPVF